MLQFDVYVTMILSVSSVKLFNESFASDYSMNHALADTRSKTYMFAYFDNFCTWISTMFL